MQLRAYHVTMRYNDAGRIIEVFANLSLEIADGSSIAVVGESGVGKTTLLFILGGIECPSEGEVYIGPSCVTHLEREGQDIAPFRGKNVGFVFQSHHLLPEFDAVENVALPLLIQGRSPYQARKRAVELLDRVGLAHRRLHRPGALSGGEQQRVAIARALCASPGVVLADEPTGNLDYKTGAQVSELLLKLHEEEKMTLVVVTHSLELASRMDRVVELTPRGLFEKRQ
jgi:lipoprotein-releasing system ATP-binding protein